MVGLKGYEITRIIGDVFIEMIMPSENLNQEIFINQEHF